MDNASIGSLWRSRDFLKLWIGQTISLAGSQVSFLALPLVAGLTLNATPWQMGLLSAASGLPALFGPFVGFWIDRLPRRLLLIVADLLRASLLLIIPAMYLTGSLRLGYLYLVALLLGVGNMVFDIAYGAYLPNLLERNQLVEGNSKLEWSRSLAEVGGPGLAGVLIDLFSAPVTLMIDALSYLGSALFLGLIRRPEMRPLKEEHEPFWNELRSGLRVVWHEPLLRTLLVMTGLINLCNGIVETVAFLYLPRTLGISAGLFGFIFSIGSLGAVVCAMVLPRVSARLGVGRSLLVGLALVGSGDLLTGLAFGRQFVLVLQLCIGALMFGCGIVFYRIMVTTLRQTITPHTLLGRVGAIFYMVNHGVAPLGALAGGFLGEVFTVQIALIIGACGELAVLVWLWKNTLGQVQFFPNNET